MGYDALENLDVSNTGLDVGSTATALKSLTSLGNFHVTGTPWCRSALTAADETALCGMIADVPFFAGGGVALCKDTVNAGDFTGGRKMRDLCPTHREAIR